LAGAAAAWLFLPAAPQRATPALVSADRLTHDPGISEWPTWSPDGSLLAFASNREGNLEVYVRQVAGGQEVDISDDPGQDFQPAFSPDGKSIAFISTRSSATGMIEIGSQFGFEFRTYGGDLWLAPALGGRAQRLAERANMPAWSPDGARIAYIGGPEEHRSIKQVGVDGSEAPTLLRADRSRWEIVRIQYTPDGKSLTFEATDSTIWMLPVSGGEPRFLLDGTSHTWGPKGDRLFTLTRAPLGGTRIGMVPFDPATGTAGKPVTIGVMTGILNHLAISADGRHLAVSEMEGSMNLTMLRLDAAGDGPAGEEVPLSHGQVIDRYPGVSPDGTLVAYSSNRLGPEEIWVRNLETGHADRLELPGKDIGVNTPLWFPDGKSLIVTRFYPNGTRSLWRVALDGSDARELVAPLPDLEGGYVLPDGRTISYTYAVEGRERPFLMDLATKKSRPEFDVPGDVFSVLHSPDGRWIVFQSNASGSIQLWRRPAAGGEPERLTTGEDRIRHASISPDSRYVYFQPNHQNIYRIPITGGEVEQVTHFDPSGLFIEEPRLSPDGKILVYSRSHG
ncbi:MAG TPA: hypothetical protein VNI57_00890, partial [Candidatus Saccharimonadales bacterium]|nr:hypothetical protein [Candidatus Saccharimonadales bacterium]